MKIKDLKYYETISKSSHHNNHIHFSSYFRICPERGQWHFQAKTGGILTTQRFKQLIVDIIPVYDRLENPPCCGIWI